MKKNVALLVCCWLGVTGVMAQTQVTSVELSFDRETYIVGEELTAKVRITNFSGQTLMLGSEPNWLTFMIENSAKRVVSRLGPVPALPEFKLDSAMVATHRTDLAPIFNLAEPGQYTVRATVRIPQLQISVESNPASFLIISGTVLWQQDFGVPLAEKAADRKPEMRKYALLQVTQERDLKLYFRLTDVKGAKTFRVFPLGNLTSISKPEQQLDQWSNLHVLYQNGAQSFLYSMINPEGVLIARETHIWTTSRPRLEPRKDGGITVTGGTRRYTADDKPPVLPNSAAVSQPDAVPSQP